MFILQTGDNISEELLLHIWLSLVAHVKNMVELASKRDSVGVFNDFMRCVECLTVAWPNVSAHMIMVSHIQGVDFGYYYYTIK